MIAVRRTLRSNVRAFSISLQQLTQQRKAEQTAKPNDNLYRHLYKPQTRPSAPEQRASLESADDHVGDLYPFNANTQERAAANTGSQADSDMGDTYNTFRPLHHPKVSE
jgi:hypothetical protein